MIDRRELLIAGAVASLVFPARAEDANSKSLLALVIGNNTYSENIGSLKNATNDADVIGSALKQCGFKLYGDDVIHNADRNELMSAIRGYRNGLKSAGNNAIGFFYYAGHGAAHIERGNFLIPTGDYSELNDELWDDSLSLDWLFKRLGEVKSPQIVCIDACRNLLKLPAASADRSPAAAPAFRSLRASSSNSDSANMFLSYATWEGQTASDGNSEEGNGPYARALEANLGTRQQTIRDMFEDVRLDVLEQTLNIQEPMNLSRLKRQSKDLQVVRSVDKTVPPVTGATQTTSHERNRASPSQALIISNQYQFSEGLSLNNTREDAELVENSLLRNGFITERDENVGWAEFFNTVTDFKERLSDSGSAAVGILYFAGYGASLDGNNYLLPETGRLPEKPQDLRAMGVSVKEIVQILAPSTAQAIIIIIDCGRVFDFRFQTKSIQQGFARDFGTENVVIAYTTAPGSIALDGKGNSVYATVLSEQLVTEDRIDVDTLFQRVSQEVALRTDGAQRPYTQSTASLPIFFRSDAGLDIDSEAE